MKNNTEKVSNISFFEVINNLLKKKESFICSRLPGSKQVSLNSGIVTKLKRSEIQDNGIFVMPFIEKNLGWMLNPSLNYETIIEKKLNSKNNNFLNVKDLVKNEEKENYTRSVKNLIKEIDKGKLSKIVFSKKITLKRPNSNCVSIFKNILDSYNDAFCYFFYTPKEGVWLGASPELLFKKEKNSILTMALAGTKFNISSEWGDKEYSEQKIVQDELIENLRPLCSSLSFGETETVSAGKIQHLKTSFEGTTQASTIKLINALFPSSAIAGYPRKTALKLISKYELHERSFYSGFLGMCKGNNSSFFVNLRCFNVKDDKISLYVGSGITKDSDPDNEWMEILKKSETMLNVIF